MKVMSRDLKFFLLASMFLGVTTGIDSAFFNNYLSDVFHITVFQRTLLEIPRELPGFLVVFVSGMLIFLGDVRVACVANLLAAAGMMGLGILSPGIGVMVGWMTVYSMGQHLYMPVASSIGMNLAVDGNLGGILGRIQAYNTAAYLVSSLVIAGLFMVIHIPYRVAFGVGAVAFVLAALMILQMAPHRGPKPKKAIIIRKRYRLFYVLSVLYGARKQIFITFGPWVLIKAFHQGVGTFAIISFTTAFLGIFFRPWLGNLVDRKGPRFVIMFEAIFLIAVCFGYAWAQKLFGNTLTALLIVSGCFVLDQLLNAATMARAIYVKKIAGSAEEVSPTLAMGTTIDHSISMGIPWVGGLVWDHWGYSWVFIGGAVIALGNLILSSGIHTDRERYESEQTK